MVLYAARQGRAPGPDALEALRLEHHVAPAEHDATILALRRADGPIMAQAREALDLIDGGRRALRRARSTPPATRLRCRISAATSAGCSRACRFPRPTSPTPSAAARRRCGA